jgi:hypothetical protein
MRLLKIVLVLLILAYGTSWFATVPEIHRRQTDGAITSSSAEATLPLRGEGLSYGTLTSKAYPIAPFYYYGEVSRRFGPQDGYPTMRHYIGIGSLLHEMDADPHAEALEAAADGG